MLAKTSETKSIHLVPFDSFNFIINVGATTEEKHGPSGQQKQGTSMKT